MPGKGGNGAGSFEHLLEPHGKEAAVDGSWWRSDEEAAFLEATRIAEENERERQATAPVMPPPREAVRDSLLRQLLHVEQRRITLPAKAAEIRTA